MTKSLNETVRESVANALDDKVDLSIFDKRKALIQKIQSEHSDYKQNSITSAISRCLEKEQKKTGRDFGVKRKPQFDESLRVKTKDGSIKPTNPNVQTSDTPKDKQILGNYPLESCESMGNLAYSAFSITDSDMEDLTEQERKDVGVMLKPLLDRYASGDRGTLLVSTLSIMMIFLNKKRQAMKKRKERKKLSKTETPISKEIQKPKVITDNS